MTKRKVITIILSVILISGMIFLASCNATGEDENSNSQVEQGDTAQNQDEPQEDEIFPIEIGQKAPNFVLENLKGEQESLEDYRGKDVIINFWTIRCPYCVKEMPEFEKFYTDYKDKDFSIIAVNVGERKNEVDSFVDENGYTFPVLLDKTGEVAYKYQVQGVPTSIVIDKEGIIRGIRLGPMAYPELKQRIDSIEGR